MAFDREKFRDLYPFESCYLPLVHEGGTHRLHYLDEGKGSPVLLVHGNPTWSFYYRDLIRELRTSHRVIAPDHIGCGLSDKPGDAHYEYVLEQRVSDLGLLVDHLELRERITLVVHDWGGMIGLLWAIRNPDRVAKIVVLNTAGFQLPASKALPLTLRMVRDVSLFGRVAVRGFNAFAGLATRMAVKKPMSARVREGMVAPYDSWKNRIATLRFVEDIPLRPGDASWDAVQCADDGLPKLSGIPMLVGWGRHDFVFDNHFLDEWRRRFPAAEFHVFEDAGHYVLEDAGDRLIPLIRGFVDRPVVGNA